MPDALAVPVWYGVLAWLACWDVTLAVHLAPGPLGAELVLHFLIVTACLLVVLVKLAGRRWLW